MLFDYCESFCDSFVAIICFSYYRYCSYTNKRPPIFKDVIWFVDLMKVTVFVWFVSFLITVATIMYHDEYGLVFVIFFNILLAMIILFAHL